MTDTLKLWAAVDRLTRPTPRKVERSEGEWVIELASTDSRWCDVNAYRAATTAHTLVPSLWEQAVTALDGHRERGGGPSGPKAERTPADLDLMEITTLIRETISDEFKKRQQHLTQRPPVDVPARMRRLASLIVTHDPDDLEWWEYRFESWGRLLETYLGVAEHRPRQMRLRDTACEACGERSILTDGDHGPVRQPALVIDFTPSGFARGVECMACGHTIWRGAEMEDFARRINQEKTA